MKYSRIDFDKNLDEEKDDIIESNEFLKDNDFDETGGVMKVELDIVDESSDLIQLIFVLPNKEEKLIFAHIGESILDISKKNNLPLEGACGGALACSTCHVVIEEDYFKNELAQITDMEEDMLDMVVNLKRTSRLGCQIIVQKWMNNMRIFLYNDGNFTNCLCNGCNCC